MNTGPAIGGPADNQELSAKTQRIGVPVIMPGKPGVGVGYYRWTGKVWVWNPTLQ